MQRCIKIMRVEKAWQPLSLAANNPMSPCMRLGFRRLVRADAIYFGTLFTPTKDSFEAGTKDDARHKETTQERAFGGQERGSGVSAKVMIGLHHVAKHFASAQAIRDFSMEIYQGEFVTLLGASGSGKTTILRMIAGFESVSTGHIIIDGVDMTQMPANQRPVNSVFQNYALFPHLNVFDNVAFGLRIKKVPEQTIRTRVYDALAMVGLEKFASRRIRQLSGGQQQRVAIVRALINEPKVLLLDEPLSALDLKLRKEMQLELKRLHRELGITFLYVTHDQEEAMSLSDRIGVLAQGELLQYASPEELYSSPSSPAVAGFIGETNLLTGSIVDVTKGYTIVQTPYFLTKTPMRADHVLGAPVVLSVRPEALHLGAFGDQALCRGVVTERIFGGSLVHLWIRVAPDLTLHCVSHGVNQTYALGEEVDVQWDPNHSLAFCQTDKPPSSTLPGIAGVLGSNGSDGP